MLRTIALILTACTELHCSYYPSDTGVLPRSMDDSAEIAANLLPVLGETNLELIEAIVAAAVEKASSGHEVHTAPSYKR